MSTQPWYELARLVSDHAGWEEEKSRLEALIRDCVDAAGEEYGQVLFAGWGRLPGGARLFVYETSSPVVRESFHLAALAHDVYKGKPAYQDTAPENGMRWVCPGDQPPDDDA